MISQTDTEYLFHIIQYQNNSAKKCSTKAFQKNRYFDADSLDIYQHHLIKSGNIIHEKRKSFNEKFSPIVQKFYQLISDGKEDIEINYQSDLSEQDFEALLIQNLEKTEY